MSKKGGIPSPKQQKPSRIPEPQKPEEKEPPRNGGYPLIRFRHADPNKYLVRDWQKDELDDLFPFFVKLEQMSWAELFGQGSKNPARKQGFAMTYLNQNQVSGMPKSVSPDKRIFELRVCKKKRVMGFRDGDVFTVIWYDRGHDVCG